MAIIHNVNFKVKTAQYTLDKKYQNLLKDGKIKQDELEDFANKYNNVIQEMKIIWEVIK
tara:strand:- start:309 stop:485 length:177 start_codon:yes stop_codon:yes gene_type:complete